MERRGTLADSGVRSLAELKAGGISEAQLKRVVRDGTLARIRRGWYARPDAHPVVVEAVAAGGVLSCVSALRCYGVWVPPMVSKVHVRAARHAHSQGRRVRYCTQYGRPEAEYGAVDDVRTALRHALRCLDAEGVVVVCDSILNRKLLCEADLVAECASAPPRLRALLGFVDGRADSGTESMARLRLRKRRIVVEPQAHIPGVGRVDLRVGRSVIVECDSVEHHTSATNYVKDRLRDREALRLGYRPFRFTYQDVVYDWESAAAGLYEVIERGGHLSVPRAS